MRQLARLPTRRRECQRGPTAHAVAAALLLSPLTLALDAGTSRLAFEDATARLGVQFTHVASPTPEKHLVETMGAGVAVFDANGDGRLDIFFVNGAAIDSPMASEAPVRREARHASRLFVQRADGRFEDQTARAGLAGIGYGMGVATGDYDNDGDTDLYVTAYGGNRLYRNHGDGRFEDVTAAAGVGADGWSTSAAFVDVDHDGWLDLFVARYLTWSFARNRYCGEPPPGVRAYCHPDQFQGASSRLFRNDGRGAFVDVSATAGIDSPEGKALGVAIADYDRDGRIDIFVANDSVREFLFRNLGGGRFVDAALEAGAALDEDGRAFAGMGVAFDDHDDDGWPDLVVTTLSNQLYASFRNEGGGRFTYNTRRNGLAALTRLYSGWGIAVVDLDNDGRRDLIVAQGHVLDTIEQTSPHLRYRQPLLLARGGARGFTGASADAGPIFAAPLSARGLAIGDLDADGRVDVVVTVNDGPARVLLNRSTGTGHWLGLRLVGIRSNRDGIGAAIAVDSTDGRTRYATVSTSGSYLSASDRTAHIGLGAAQPTRIVIRWPSGVEQVVAAPRADRVLTITEPAAAPLR